MSKQKRNKNITVLYAADLDRYRAYDSQTRRAHWSRHSGAQAREELDSGTWGVQSGLTNEQLMCHGDLRCI